MSDHRQPHDASEATRGVSFFSRYNNALVERLARGPIYYGWYIVAVVLLIGIPRVGLNGHFFGIFMKPIAEEFGWTRAETTGAVTVGTLVAAALGIILGRVLDRYGPRWMMVGGCTLLAFSYLGLSWVNSLVAFYFMYSIGRSMMQSATGHTLMYSLVSKWFVRRRATAIAIATLGGVAGGVVLAPITQELIDKYSWREAWAFFGVMTVLVALVPSVILLRRIPEDLGLRPDGDERHVLVHPGPPAYGEFVEEELTPYDLTRVEVNLTSGEAVRTLTFWLLTVMISLNAVALTGVTFHMVPHFTDIGIISSVAARSVSVATFTQMASVFAWGFLADRLGPKRVLLACLLNLVVGTLMIANAHGDLGSYLGASVFGVGMGGNGLLQEVVWADFYGRKYLGSIRGVAMVFQMVGNAAGSLLAAYLYDLTGNYHEAFRVIEGALLVSFVLLLLARKPRPDLAVRDGSSLSSPAR